MVSHQVMIISICVAVLAGCSGNTKRQPAFEPGTRVPSVASTPQAAETKVLPVTLLDRLYAQYHRWQGTPWRLGGNSLKGLDCSAFTQRVYSRQFGRELPRTTEQQQRLGITVAVADLQAGDLVFFRPGRRGRHVGVYLENGQFMHVSTRIGVTISKLDNPWWRSVYWKGTRP